MRQNTKGRIVKRTYRRTLVAVLEALLFASILALMLCDITWRVFENSTGEPLKRQAGRM